MCAAPQINPTMRYFLYLFDGFARGYEAIIFARGQCVVDAIPYFHSVIPKRLTA
jgi:hypothetical protein